MLKVVCEKRHILAVLDSDVDLVATAVGVPATAALGQLLRDARFPVARGAGATAGWEAAGTSPTKTVRQSINFGAMCLSTRQIIPRGLAWIKTDRTAAPMSLRGRSAVSSGARRT